MNILIVITVFFAMEGATWLIHKYVMHGFLWSLHADHHDHSTEGPFEKNDYFFVIFALPVIAVMYYGSTQGFNYIFYIGLGIALYGMAYFFVHDIFIHQRFSFLKNTKNPYLWPSEERTSSTISIWESMKENVLVFYGCQ